MDVSYILQNHYILYIFESISQAYPTMYYECMMETSELLWFIDVKISFIAIFSYILRMCDAKKRIMLIYINLNLIL